MNKEIKNFYNKYFKLIIVFGTIKKVILLFLMVIPLISFSQKISEKTIKFNPEIHIIEVEASCGICLFNMEGSECKLAVKLNNVTYYVEGTGIDDHGDAHSKSGFCNAIRTAEVQGKIIDNKFHATYFELKRFKD